MPIATRAAVIESGGAPFTVHDVELDEPRPDEVLVRMTAAGLCHTDLARAHRVAARLDAGIVWVNDWAMLDPAVPFGGVKSSGFGREYGPEGLAAYTRDKSVVISLD